ncbi:hypothetical protein LTR05_006975 [Lithohypha guttulata]|uniref:Uncharacterized protein n=1 Tax=Lithohypha guttulata TaxID=1690604 RepID=A0AAN7YEY7_9EURO|nr:hypothetical protein LTR05_006975 [Lithohypha guttulata]
MNIKPGLLAIWQSLAIEEALQHDFLLSGILALSAYHLAATRHEIRTQYTCHALEYQAAAFAKFQQNVRSVGQQNANAIFLFTIVNMLCTLAQISSPIGSEQKTVTHKVAEIFSCLQGMGSISHAVFEYISTGPTKILIDDYCSENIDDNGGDFDSALDSLETHIRSQTSNVQYEKSGRGRAIECLRSCKKLGRPATIVWMSMVDRSFMELVLQKDLFAILIVAFWGALMNDLRSFWWAGEIGRELIEEFTTASLDSLQPTQSAAVLYLRSKIEIGNI